MDIRDSQRIKQICDNTEKMVDVFNRIADALERLIEPSDSEKPNICKDESQEWWLTENSLDDFRTGFMHGYAQAKHEYEPKTEQNNCETCEQLERCNRGRAVDCPITEPCHRCSE